MLLTSREGGQLSNGIRFDNHLSIILTPNSELVTLTLRNRIRSTHSPRLQMAGLVDMKGIQAKSTWGEFRQMNQKG
jgi:hypothetical protein